MSTTSYTGKKRGPKPGPRRPGGMCYRGHVVTGGNLYVAPDGTTHCRRCRSIAVVESKRLARLRLRMRRAAR